MSQSLAASERNNTLPECSVMCAEPAPQSIARSFCATNRPSHATFHLKIHDPLLPLLPPANGDEQTNACKCPRAMAQASKCSISLCWQAHFLDKFNVSRVVA